MIIDSVCGYCGVGCEISAEIEDNSIKKIISKKESEVSKGQLCIKGRLGYNFLNSPNRILGAFISQDFINKNNLNLTGKNKIIQNREFLKVPYKIAYKIVANKIQEIIKKYSNYSFCAIGGARTNCESGFLMQKFTREIIKSPHVDNCARICHSPSLKGLRKTIGEGASTNPFNDFKHSELFLVIGSNTTEAHPIVANKILQAKKNGAEIITIDIRKTGLFKHSKINLILPYESNLLILNMLAYVILSENLENKSFIKKRGKYFEEYRNSILNDKYANPNFFRQIKGYEYLADLIPKVARLYATKKSMILWGLGITEHIDGSYSVMAISHLALLTGNIGKSGTGLIPLRGQNNVQGACDVGMLPYYNPDYLPPKEIGKMTPDLIDGMISGEIKALFNMGEDIAHVHANLNKVHKGLEKLDLLIVNDILFNEITKFSDIIFGVKSSYEKTGVYVNAERRLHLSQPFINSSLPDDWEVIQEISKLLQSDWTYQNSEDVWNDVRKSVKNRYGQANYEKLIKNRLQGLQWPVSEIETPILHKENFRTKDGLGHFHYYQWELRGQVKELLHTKTNSFYLSTGRTLKFYNNGSQTQDKLRDSNILFVSDSDEVFHNKTFVKLKTPFGESSFLKIQPTNKLKKGTLFTTFHNPKNRINFLFGDNSDNLIKAPCFKSLKVDLIFKK